MKILFCVPDLLAGKKGGAERIAVAQANRLVKKGHQVAIVSKAHNNDTTSYALDEGIAIIRIEGKSSDDLLNVLPLCKSFNPDVYFFFYYSGDILWQYLLGRLLSVKMGAQECTNPHRCVRNIATSLQISNEEAFTLRNAIGLSLSGVRVLLDSYKKCFPIAMQNRVKVFKNSFPKIASSEKVEKQPIILNINGASGKENKSAMILLKAFASIAHEYPDWKIHILGKASKEKVFTEYAQQNGFEDRLVFLGESDNVTEHYARSAVHVICSFEEGLPNVVCEAMLNKVPSIGFSDCDGTNSIIEHERNGLLIERDDSGNSLALALKRLINTPSQRESYGQNGYNQALEEFDEDKVNSCWDSLIAMINESSFTPPSRQYRDSLFALDKIIAKYYPIVAPNPKMQPSVDFIVPLYNKVDEVEKTINSILNTEYVNFRIIIVDDCSTDGSYELVQKLYSNDQRIKIVLREKNGGLSTARNTGLEYAQADFIQFWDADDIYNASALSELVYASIVGFSDIVTGLAERNGKILPTYELSGVTSYAIKQPFCFVAFQTMSTCFKLYRRSFLEKHNLRFIDGLYMQDAEFNLRAFSLATSVSITATLIGDYTNTATARGSQEFSEKRLDSAFIICDEYLNNKSRYATTPEYYAEYIIIKFVLKFFIARILPNLHADPKNEQYLKSIVNYLKKMKKGIRYHFYTHSSNDFERGLTYMYLIQDKVKDATDTFLNINKCKNTAKEDCSLLQIDEQLFSYRFNNTK